MLHYLAVEVDFGFRPSSPGRRVVVYVLQNSEDVARSAQVVSNSVGVRVATLCGSPNLASWRNATLCHDFVILHGPTLLAALEERLVAASDLSLCVLDSQLVDDSGFSEALLNLLAATGATKQTRLFLVALHKQADAESFKAAELAKLARTMSCEAFMPLHAPGQHLDEVVFYTVDTVLPQDTRLFTKLFSLDPKRVLHDCYAKAREVYVVRVKPRASRRIRLLQVARARAVRRRYVLEVQSEGGVQDRRRCMARS